MDNQNGSLGWQVSPENLLPYCTTLGLREYLIKNLLLQSEKPQLCPVLLLGAITDSN